MPETIGSVVKNSEDPDVLALVVRLQNKDWDIRREAGEALVERGMSAVPTLLRTIRYLGAEYWSEVASALGRIGDTRAITVLQQYLSDKDPLIQIKASEALGKLRDASAVPVLISALQDEEAEVRAEAADALEKLGYVVHGGEDRMSNFVELAAGLLEAAPFLVTALTDTDATVRSKAAGALGYFGSDVIVPRLLDALQDTDFWVRANAVESLGNIGDTTVVYALVALLLDKESFVRSSAAEALGRLGDVSVAPDLIMALEDANATVRSNAAFSLGFLQASLASPYLERTLEDSDSFVQYASISALGDIGNPAATPALVAVLRNTERDMLARVTAAISIGKLGDASAVPILLEYLAGDGSELCEAAINGLSQITTPGGVETLIDALKDEREAVRIGVVEALGSLNDIPAALPALKRAISDPAGRVRKAAADALRQIEAEQKSAEM